MKIGINGLGRIGRLVLRAILENSNSSLEVVAVNDIVSADHLAYLLKYDSVHRTPAVSVAVQNQQLRVDGKPIEVFSEMDPSKLPWRKLGVEYVVESTGRFVSLEDARGHLDAGAKRVVITAPAGDEVPTFCMGVNHLEYCSGSHFIVSNSSCTTNCLAVLAKVLLDRFGIEEGLATTIHSLTASQAVVDSPAKKNWRAGRAAGINIIPSSTGAARSVALCLPAVKDKIRVTAFRIPTSCVSLIDLTVRLTQETTYTEVCNTVKTEAEGPLGRFLAYCEDEVVSSDFIGSPYSCIFDKGAGMGLNRHFYKFVAWYDNEAGYAHRVVDLLEFMETKE